MSEQEERWESDEEKDEVEAHRKPSKAMTDEPRSDEENDEVEAHAHRGKAMTDEPRSDEESGDDFEAHRFKA